MTVCVGVTVNDCVVFAADSASSLSTVDAQGNSRVLNVYKHGDKVFNLYKGLPIAGMTCGLGNFGLDSIATIAKRLRQRLTDGDEEWRLNREAYTMKEIAEKVRKIFFDECFHALIHKPNDSFEFWVGGYSSDHSLGHEVWKVTIAGAASGEPELVRSGGEPGLFWGGQIEPVSRLVLGYDPMLKAAVTGAGMDPEGAMNLEALLRSRFEKPLLFAQMPVIDAIELADFLVETTKRYFRFLPGADIVGGDTDIAVVTRFEGFKWIKRKHYYPAKLNRLETDHV